MTDFYKEKKIKNFINNKEFGKGNCCSICMKNYGEDLMQC